MIDVCAAVICRRRRFLLARRPPGSHLSGFWEFPGGKQHPGESLAECLQRELREELHLDAEVPQFLTTVEHRYPEKHIRLHFLTCRIPLRVSAIPAEGQEVGWFTAAEVLLLKLAPADRIFAENYFSESKRL